MLKWSLFVSLLFLQACGTGELTCAADQRKITDPHTAFVVAVPRTSSVTILNFDEQHDQIVPLSAMAEQEHVPIEHIADGSRHELYCSKACAAKELARRNAIVDSVLVQRQAEHVVDSLVMDSIRRGLL
ncbi:MAG: hypothetical protein IT229_10645 [Flavobacteriales bacterium]|nr:hypothetical protein [Flavobacteriales bacterium]